VTDTSLIGLLEGTGAVALGASDVAVSGVSYRSDRVRPGDVFFCVPGFAHDGHDFAADAVQRGAVAVVVQRELDGITVPQFLVNGVRAALAVASARFEGEPSQALELIGITGTNGKTTTVYLLDSILRSAGHRTGLIGTVETRVGEERLDSSRTTPESSDLQRLLAHMRDSGVTAAAIEVSSHAIDLHRIDALHFSAVAFTNLTQDHLDYHHTLEEYASVKRRLFTDFEARARVVNIDDPYGALMVSEVHGVLTVGRRPDSIVRADDEEPSATGTTFTLSTPQGSARVNLPLAGAYNVSNALVAAGCALSIGVSLETIVAGLAAAPQVPGRLERVECGQPFTVIVDYAHTPDSLEKALLAVKQVTPGRVIAVFGCGGDRDPDKRPMMGAAVAAYADAAVITSDNPRSEDPVGIILQVEDGVRGSSLAYEVEVDRRKAIGRALQLAEPGDAVLIAGKGHEDYQIFADRTIHFDDREVAREELASRC
jgi:UDP-N-acetylmuramoyl-L-alanyl-D-glutamate--2,6-diaminopimelate ligase